MANSHDVLHEPAWVRHTLIALAVLAMLALVVLPLGMVLAAAFAKGAGVWLAALREPDALSALKLTLFTAAVVIPINAVFGLFAAWALARFDFRGKTALMFGILATSMIPGIAILVPLYNLSVKTGLYNTLTGMVIVYTAWNVPLLVWLLKGFFEKVPRELEEAARLDGAPPRTALLRVTLPLVLPQLATAALLAFLASWDELTFALLLQVTNRTLPPLLYYLSAFGFPGLSSAVAAVMLLPSLVLLLVIGRAFRPGVLSGSGR